MLGTESSSVLGMQRDGGGRGRGKEEGEEERRGRKRGGEGS